MGNFYIALENLRSLYNIGAIFRTCSFLGVWDVILVGYSGKMFDLKGRKVLNSYILKTSLGSENDLNIIFLKSSGELISFAKDRNLRLVSIEQSEKSTRLNEWEPGANSILVFGNEVDGVSQEILNASNEIVEISRHGKHGSLNVTTACGIVLNKIANPS
jgi:23S rRNA (guanosine2251-2'-O)-methyltransferase